MSEAGGSFRPVRVLVADDLVLCREGLALLLSRKQIQVVGVAGDRPELIGLVTSRRPDVVLLGFDLPDHELESTIRMLRASWPLTKILVLSRYDDPALVRGALSAGAHGFVTKSLSGIELVAAIGAVQRDGERGVVSMSRDSLARYGDGKDNVLTPREAEVLRLAADALTNTQIAGKLGIAESTVKRHLTNAYARLGADSRIDAINKAVAFGVIKLPTVGRVPALAPPVAPEEPTRH